MSKAVVVRLKAILEASETTAAFLGDVQRAIESLYAEDEDAPDCPEGFAALDTAIEAFEAAELAATGLGEEGEDDDS